MENLLTVEQIAERLGLSTRTVYLRLNDGSLPGFKLGGKWLMREAALRRYLRQQERSFFKPSVSLKENNSPEELKTA